ncbi:MAG TPA: hypothetical protein VEQ60_19215, partial [Longimicrobium sp.]|nr:hypothetical protein [Longimicrobium sp.]
ADLPIFDPPRPISIRRIVPDPPDQNRELVSTVRERVQACRKRASASSASAVLPCARSACSRPNRLHPLCGRSSSAAR